ncbi:MAG: hypothetical protein LBQ13_04290 [Endomicrobium sp.]|jgi:hypothetical protein|nr:hypothetical protein [Endomicrobium sp.]
MRCYSVGIDINKRKRRNRLIFLGCACVVFFAIGLIAGRLVWHGKIKVIPPDQLNTLRSTMLNQTGDTTFTPTNADNWDGDWWLVGSDEE